MLRYLLVVCLLVSGIAQASVAPVPPGGARPLDPLALRSDLQALAQTEGRLSLRAQSEEQLERRQLKVRRRLAAKWLPVLLDAEARGDALASVVLRDCNSAPTLIRDGLDTNCSYDPAARTRGELRLSRAKMALGLGLGVGGADERIDALFAQRLRADCPQAGRDSSCASYLAIELLQAQLKAAVASAQVESIPHWNPGVCPRPQASAELKPLAEQCDLLQQQLWALKTLARRHFSLSVVEADDEGRRVGMYPYSRFGDIALVTAAHRQPSAGQGDPEVQTHFYTAVFRSLEAMEKSVDAMLAREPRLAVFFFTTPVAKKRKTESAASGGQRKATRRTPALTVGMRATPGCSNRGDLIANGTASVVTKLYPVGPAKFTFHAQAGR